MGARESKAREETPAGPSFEAWTGTWAVESRDGWAAYLAFFGLQEPEVVPEEFHRYRVDADAFTMEHEVQALQLHRLFRADLDGALRAAAGASATVGPPLPAAESSEGGVAETNGLKFRSHWLDAPAAFRTELLVPGSGAHGTMVVRVDRRLTSGSSINLALTVFPAGAAGAALDQEAALVGPCALRLARRSAAGPAPVAFLRMRGAPLETVEQRRRALAQASRMITEHIDDISAAQEKDRVFPSRFNGVAQMLIGGSSMYQDLVEEWMRPEKIDDACPPVLQAGVPADWSVVHEPKGVCINVSPWNAPVQLSVIPMLAMLASGNHCIVKPPELVPNVSALFRRLCQQYLDGYVWVEEGSKDAVERLIDEGADHLVFTGGGEIAKVVAARCAQMLTPVTLELGGKSPLFIDAGLQESTLDAAVREIMELKVHKTGQFCCAHDYALVHEDAFETFCAKFRSAVEALGEKRHVALLGRRQYEVIKDKLEEAAAECIPALQGGFTPDDDAMTVPFTGLLHPSPVRRVLTAEIFGPLLPILKVRDVDEAIGIINRMVTGKPLIAYCYSENGDSIEAFIAQTSSGNVAVNSGPQRMISNFNCAIGGIGPSGTGASMWGREAMREFSNRKHVIRARGGFAKSFFSGPPPAAP